MVFERAIHDRPYKSLYRSSILSFKEISRAFLTSCFQLAPEELLLSFLVLFVSLTLFNLQGARPASLTAGVLFIVALGALLVKNFFQVFSEFLLPGHLVSVLFKPVRPFRRELD